MSYFEGNTREIIKENGFQSFLKSAYALYGRCGNRTHYLRLRRPALYPDELTALLQKNRTIFIMYIQVKDFEPLPLITNLYLIVILKRNTGEKGKSLLC